MQAFFFVLLGRSHDVSQPDLMVSRSGTKDIISENSANCPWPTYLKISSKFFTRRSLSSSVVVGYTPWNSSGLLNFNIAKCKRKAFHLTPVLLSLRTLSKVSTNLTMSGKDAQNISSPFFFSHEFFISSLRNFPFLLSKRAAKSCGLSPANPLASLVFTSLLFTSLFRVARQPRNTGCNRKRST